MTTVKGPLAPYNSLGMLKSIELKNAEDVLRNRPLSGYLGGERHGGYWVERLEEEWCQTFDCNHAVAVNSATSGLLAACVAADIYAGDTVATTPFTMSATAAAPAFLGAKVEFADIDLSTYCIDPEKIDNEPRAIIATNLFGHPAPLGRLWNKKTFLIEDNAQAPFAMEGGRYTGTIGNVGVFSLNVHKHFQCGEGGICVTPNNTIADRMRMFRNHGEMSGRGIGLNLRMTEVTAAIACAQLARGKALVQQRVEIAEAILDQISNVPGLFLPITKPGCRHVYYCLAFYVDSFRDWFVDALVAEGVPLQKGYVKPLYHLPAFRQSFGSCPNAEKAHSHIAIYENCAWTPTSEQIKQIGEAFRKVADRAQKIVEAH